MNKLMFLMVGLLIIPLVSANGLNIVSNITTFNMNKTYNQDKSITFTIKNEEPFSFYNITFKDNDIITMSRINELTSGNSKEVTATVKTNNDFNGDIEIIGYFESQLGIQNKSYNITVTTADGLEVCDFSIVKGDKVTWFNKIPDEIRLKNMNADYVTTIEKNGSYTTTFDEPEIFEYAFYRRGSLYTDICQITVLDDVGYVNDPNLNEIITLNIDMKYEETTIQATLFTDNFTLNFLESADDVIIIKNTGTKVARNIKLSGDWFTFNKNNFDLDPDKSTVVVYNIKELKPGITNTTNTNKTYDKNITITGNFDKVVKHLDVFIKYAEIGENYTSGETWEQELKNKCEDDPDYWLCPKTRIVYRDINDTLLRFNVTYEQEQCEQMTSLMFDKMDGEDEIYNYMKRVITDLNQTIQTMSSKVNNLETNIIAEKTLREEQKNNLDYVWFFIAVGLLIVALIAIVFLVYRQKKLVNPTEI